MPAPATIGEESEHLSIGRRRLSVHTYIVYVTTVEIERRIRLQDTLCAGAPFEAVFVPASALNSHESSYKACLAPDESAARDSRFAQKLNREWDWDADGSAPLHSPPKHEPHTRWQKEKPTTC